MNSIESITGKILAEAGADAEKTLAAARKRADEAVSVACGRAEIKADAIKQRAEKACKEIYRRSEAVTDLDKRKMTLSAKREIIDEVFAGIEKAVLELPPDKYTAFTVKTVLAAGDRFPKIIFAEGDRAVSERIIKALKANGREFSEIDYTDKIERGFMLADGSVGVNYSIKEYLYSLRSELEPKVAAELFTR